MVNLSRGFPEIASGRLHPGRVCRPVNPVPPFRVRAELRRGAPAISSGEGRTGRNVFNRIIGNSARW